MSTRLQQTIVGAIAIGVIVGSLNLPIAAGAGVVVLWSVTISMLRPEE